MWAITNVHAGRRFPTIGLGGLAVTTLPGAWRSFNPALSVAFTTRVYLVLAEIHHSTSTRINLKSNQKHTIQTANLTQHWF